MSTSITLRSVLVTGGAGFIGSNLVRKLVNAGHRVLNVDKLTYAGNLDSLVDIAGSDRYEFVKGDIADEELMTGLIARFKPDRVMHLAAESHVDRSIEGPLEFVRTNVMGTVVMLRAAHSYWNGLGESEKSNFRFVHLSTDEVYGALGETGQFTETHRYDPHSPYSASKASSDHFVRAWADTYGLPVVMTNCSNAYGPYQFPEKLIPVVILKALHGESIPVYGSGRNVRDWLHVEDLCEALILVSEEGSLRETYNIGGGNEWRNITLVETLCDLVAELSGSGKDLRSLIEFVTDRPGHDFRYSIDFSKIREELGWTPQREFSEGLRDTVRWYLENRAWWISKT